MPRKVFAVNEILTASDVNEYFMNQAVMTFAGTAARGSAIGSPSEGMVTYLEDSDSLEVYGGTATGWVHTASAGTPSYRYVDTVYYTSNGTFAKADYPWLRAVCVKVQGAGGGGGGALASGSGTSSQGSGGSSGGYAESFITDIAGLASSVTVTRGAGGAGNSGSVGSSGGSSSFGSAVVAAGGGGGNRDVLNSSNKIILGPAGGAATAGDLTVTGSAGHAGIIVNSGNPGFNAGCGGNGGSSFFGAGGLGVWTANDPGGAGALGAGGGGAAASSASSPQGDVKTGGAGGNGIVIVELYA